VTGVQTCALPISPKPQNPNVFNQLNIILNVSKQLSLATLIAIFFAPLAETIVSETKIQTSLRFEYQSIAIVLSARNDFAAALNNWHDSCP
jgi:hypothetical protein